MKDRAALSQSKGLQNRRLPSSIANKVPQDYHKDRLRANTVTGGSMKRSASHQPISSRDEMDGGMTDEERKQRVSMVLHIYVANDFRS